MPDEAQAMCRIYSLPPGDRSWVSGHRFFALPLSPSLGITFPRNGIATVNFSYFNTRFTVLRVLD